jgi:FAD-dependent urate hydroxylase
MTLRVLVVGAGVGGIAIARGLLRDGHDVTVFERRPDVTAGGGAVTIWSNGATVLNQLGVDMAGAGQLLSNVRVTTSTGRPVAALDLTAIVERFGTPVRMVPRRVLLERLLDGFLAERIRCNRRAVQVVSTRTGWCSWQGLVTLPDIADKHVAQMIIGEHGNLGLWPAGGCDLQWWFDLPWSPGFVRPQRPIDMIRSEFAGWSDSVDRVLATLTDQDLARSPFPHFRHPIPRSGQGAVTLLGDAAHTMPPTLAQGTNQALLDTMVLRKTLSDFRTGPDSLQHGTADIRSALRWYENTRRRKVKAVSWVTTQQVSRSESTLRPAALLSDRFMTWALTTFLRSVSHRRLSEGINRDLAARDNLPVVSMANER